MLGEERNLGEVMEKEGGRSKSPWNHLEKDRVEKAAREGAGEETIFFKF